MEVKDDGTAVYNRGGLAAAKGYAEKNGEKAVLSKVDGIYKKLGLDEKKENEAYCGDAGFAKLCDMCKESPESYCKFDGEEEDDPDDKAGDKDGDHQNPDCHDNDAVKCAQNQPAVPAPESKESHEPQPGEGTPDPKDPLTMKKETKMDADPEHDHERKPNPVSDIASLISDYGWRGESLSRTIEYYEKAEDVPGKEYVIAVLAKFKAINDSCLAEAAELLEKAAKGFTEDDVAFQKRCAEHCSCGGDLKECDTLSAKCAELEKKCSESDAKCADLQKKCSDSEAKCAEAEKCSKDLADKCAAYEKKELIENAKALLAACPELPKGAGDEILAACESGSLKSLEDVKNKAARASFDAHLNGIKNTLDMPLANPTHFTFSDQAAEADPKKEDCWDTIHKISKKYSK